MLIDDILERVGQVSSEFGLEPDPKLENSVKSNLEDKKIVTLVLLSRLGFSRQCTRLCI